MSAALSGAGLVQVNRTSRDGALDVLPFYVVEWPFSFVTLLGGVLGVVAVLALLVAVEVRRRQNALAGALVPRFDPVRWLAPRSALPDQTTFVLAVAAVAIVVVLLAGWLAVRSVRTARTAELLRGRHRVRARPRRRGLLHPRRHRSPVCTT